MIKTILKIRLYQLFRFLNEIGILRVIVLVIMLAFVSMLVVNGIKQPDSKSLVPLVFGLILILVHTARKDKRFLIAAVNNVYPFYLTEYIILSLPLIIACALFNDWLGLGTLLLICSVIPLLSLSIEFHNVSALMKLLINPFSLKLNFKMKLKIPFIKPVDFEWISGIRRNFFVLIPLYLLFLTFSFKPYVAPIGIIVLSVIISGFYFFGETRELIEIFASCPREFISGKIFASLKYLSIIFFPLILISLVFHPALWYYLLGVIFISFFIQILSIIFKYALFDEHTDLSRNSIIVILNIIFIIVPLFWPVPIIMGTRYYFKALNKLKPYFHDSD